MDITLLIQSFLGLIVILAFLVFFLLYIPKKKKHIEKVKKAQKEYTREYPSLHDLLEIIKDKHSTTEELSSAVESVLKHHGTIHAKLGMRSHPDFDIYSEMLLRICRHPHTSKEIVLKFNRELEKKNPHYKIEINDAITKGLNSRGF